MSKAAIAPPTIQTRQPTQAYGIHIHLEPHCMRTDITGRDLPTIADACRQFLGDAQQTMQSGMGNPAGQAAGTLTRTRTMSAAQRKALSEAAKQRWAERRAGGTKTPAAANQTRKTAAKPRAMEATG